jgi:hypothetical protein
VPINLFLFASFGWSAYATMTARPGINGDMYQYYELTRFEFSFYTGLVSLFSLVFMTTMILNVFERKPEKLQRTLKYFLAFAIVFVVFEIFLQARFVGKG